MKDIQSDKKDDLASPLSWILAKYMDLPNTIRIGNSGDIQAFDKQLKADKNNWESEGD